jgi:acyl carrier protein
MTANDELQAVFREVFDDPELVLKPEMTARDIYGWDSLSNMTLMMAIELKFRLKIMPEEQALFRNVGDMAQHIEQRKGK